jgi:hypothetical protein
MSDNNSISGGLNSYNEGICVGIRMRPLNEREVHSGTEKIFRCQSSNNSVMHINKDNQPVETFHYDKVFDETTTTRDVYDNIAKGVVGGVMNGINGTIFACKSTLNVKFYFL